MIPQLVAYDLPKGWPTIYLRGGLRFTQCAQMTYLAVSHDLPLGFLCFTECVPMTYLVAAPFGPPVTSWDLLGPPGTS